MYNEKVMEAFQNPKNVGEVENYNGIGKVGNAACGDIMQITLRIENDVIVDAKFKTFGCGSAIASSSVASEWVKGKSLEEAMTIKNTDISNHLKLPPVKLHCSLLAEDAIKAAVNAYVKKSEKKAK